MRLFVVILCIVANIKVVGQIQQEAKSYLEYYINRVSPLEKELYKFTLATQHHNGIQSDKQRQVLVQHVIHELQIQKNELDFQLDSTVRVGFIHWLETVNSLLVKDFVALEQSRVNAQKSMEHLRAYMRVKNALRSKYLEANKFLESNMTRFALKYGITIESESTRLGERLLSANAALDYYEEIYLRFFAVKAHDKALNKAVNAKNVELIKALRSQQMDQCKQFVSELSKLSNYKGSPELKQAGIAVISSFEQTADKYGRLTYDLFAAEHQFDSLKTAVVSKPANERTNDEILAYNNAVKSYNSKVQAFEPQTQQYNLLRQKALKSWNEAVRNFSENYIK